VHDPRDKVPVAGARYTTGGAEIARPDMARPDNAAPYCETCFGVRVYAHYKFMSDSGSII